MTTPPPRSRKARLEAGLCIGCGNEPIEYRNGKGAYGAKCKAWLRSYGKTYRAELGVTGQKNKCTVCRQTGHNRAKCPNKATFVKV